MNLYLFRQLLRCKHVTVICPRVVIPRLDYIGNGLELQRVNFSFRCILAKRITSFRGRLESKIDRFEDRCCIPPLHPPQKKCSVKVPLAKQPPNHVESE